MIILRDLHENNVLVVKVETYNDAETFDEPHLLVADLGESSLTEQSYLGGSIGYRNAWAPEVKLARDYSAASDVYAMGCLVAKIISLQLDKAEENGVEHLKAPRVAIEVIKRCLDDNSETRISAEEAFRTLEDALMNDTDQELVEVNRSDLRSFKADKTWTTTGEIPY